MKTVGVVGLGQMGSRMALSLKRAGFAVIGTDASATAMAALEGQIRLATTPAALASISDTIVLSLPTAQIVEAVVSGPDGLTSALQPGTLIIDTSTSHPETTRKLEAQLRESGAAFIDAPVSGGPKRAATGELTMVLGGEAADIERAKPVLSALSTRQVHVGASGAGHMAKIVNNLMCAAHLLMAGESFRLAQAAGLDPERLLEAINGGSGRSGVTEVNFPTWVMNDAFDSGFTMQLMRKDVRLALQMAEETGLALPLTQEIGALWAASAGTIPDADDFNRIAAFRPEPTGSAL